MNPILLRKFLKNFSANLTIAPVKGSIYGLTMQSFYFKINKKRIKFHSIPEKLIGMKIVQLSDIHAGMYLKKEIILEAVKITNALKPDIV